MKAICLRDIRKRFVTQSQKYRELKKQRGMTLLEIIIVLGIIGVIAAGVVILAQRAFDTKAMSDLANNANSVRIAVKDAYGPSGQYPAEVPDDTAKLANSAALLTDTKTPIGKLVALGKLSPDEALNGISGNYIDIGPGKIGQKANAGYFIVLNGLNQQQCRGILNQVGNQWDYVAVDTGEPAGKYTAHTITMDDKTDGYKAAAGGGGASLAATGIYRSLATPTGTGAGATGGGDNLLTPDLVVGACDNGADNAVILGSR
ncbi:TPA: type IV pilus major pilin [Salmonella enterica]|nr:type IV pilus major pilin [Salmonella enterica]HDC2563021.1 type IV pilus major pilin [Salmonella enterica]